MRVHEDGKPTKRRYKTTHWREYNQALKTRGSFNDPQAMRWYRPIGLLGADDFSDDQDELTRTPMQREALSKEIIESLKHIHAYS